MKSTQSTPAVFILLGIMALGVVIWFGLPLIPGIRGTVWVSPPMRAGLAGGLFGIWLLSIGIRRWRNHGTHKRFIGYLLSQADSASESPSQVVIPKKLNWWQRRHHAIDNDSGTQQRVHVTAFANDAAPFGSIEQHQASIRDHFKGILWATRTIRNSAGKKRSLQRVPWFLVAGTSHGGKSTFLEHAGLPFPMDEVQAQNPISGSGASRDCQWWFHQDAILVEAAGRFFSRDSIAEDNEGDWNTFLRFLAGFPSGTPIQAVLLLVNIEKIIDPRHKEQEVKALRQRMADLRQYLGEQLRFYLVITHLDEILGFSESFEQASPAFRHQYWGFQLHPEQHADQSLEPRVSAAWDDLMRRLDSSTVERLQAEEELPIRLSSFALADQMKAFKPLLLEFVRELFDHSNNPTSLNGLFLSSPTQAPAKWDWIGPLIRDQFEVKGRFPRLIPELPRGYFVRGLVHEVAIPLSNNKPNGPPRPGFLALRRAVQTVLALGTLALLASWSYNTLENQRLTAELESQVTRAQASLRQLPADGGDIVDLIPALDTLSAAIEVFPPYAPLALRTGLYQGAELRTATRLAYQRSLRNVFLPRLTGTLADALRAAALGPSEKRRTAALYSSLDDPKQMDREAFRLWFQQRWQTHFSAHPEQHLSLERHLNALLSIRIPSQSLDYGLLSRINR